MRQRVFGVYTLNAWTHTHNIYTHTFTYNITLRRNNLSRPQSRERGHQVDPTACISTQAGCSRPVDAAPGRAVVPGTRVARARVRRSATAAWRINVGPVRRQNATATAPLGVRSCFPCGCLECSCFMRCPFLHLLPLGDFALSLLHVTACRRTLVGIELRPGVFHGQEKSEKNISFCLVNLLCS